MYSQTSGTPSDFPDLSSQIYYISAARIQKAALPIYLKIQLPVLLKFQRLQKCYLVFSTLPCYQCNGRYFDIFIKESTSSSFSLNTGNVLLLSIVISNQLVFFNLSQQYKHH